MGRNNFVNIFFDGIVSMVDAARFLSKNMKLY